MGAEQFGRFNIWAIAKELTDMLSNALGTVLLGRGAVPVIFRIDAVTLTGNVDTVMIYKIRVIDAWCVASAAGAAADTVTILNTAAAITNAMDLNVADTTVVRAGQVNDANHEIPKGGILRVAGASAVNAIVYVKALRVL